MNNKVNIIAHLKKDLTGFHYRYVNPDGYFKRNNIISDLKSYNSKLISILLNDKLIKNNYLKQINDINILQIDQLIDILTYSSYIKDSYTKYANSIGLAVGDHYLDYNSDVVLNFPYKDTVLKAGMTKENQSNDDEPFLNNVIAKPQIDELFEPKIFNHVIKYSTKNPKGIPINNFDINKDNLIIKGNNLIVLHSLAKRYAGKFDAIYLDPPYNVKSPNNTFSYNNNYNQSAWLTFMKNRLDITKRLLNPDTGVLIITISKEELSYLGVMLDNLFPGYEKDIITVINNPRGQQGHNFSNTCEYMFYIMPKNKDVIAPRKLNVNEVENSESNLRNWGSESMRSDGKTTFFPVIVDIHTNKIIGFGNVVPANIHPKQTEIYGNKAYVYPIDRKGKERKWRYGINTINSIKDNLIADKQNDHHYEIKMSKHWGTYRTVWSSSKYDSSVYGKQYLKKLVPHAKFSFPKSIYAVYDALNALEYVRNNKHAKILDFFSGSGTTANAVQMLNHNDNGSRIFVSVEQMDYIKSIQVPRMLAHANNKKNDPFIYAELKPRNQIYLDKIHTIKDTDKSSLDHLYNDMKSHADIEITANLSKLDHDLPMLKPKMEKSLLEAILDKNELYYDFYNIDDVNVKKQLSKSDYLFNKSFYGDGADK